MDEVGGVQEVNAVKTIAQRGVMMVATAHGVSLASLLKNPDLNGLVGGVCQVTIADAAAATNRYICSQISSLEPVF